MSQQTYTVDQALALAAGYHGRNELDQAESIYLQILKLAPNHVSALHNLGELNCRRQRYDIALQYLTRALTLEPNNPSNVNTMAVAAMSMGHADQAFQLCQRAIQLDPTFSNAHSNLGICHTDRGEMSLAVAEFEKAIQYDPNNACAHDGLGLTLLMLGDLQRGWREQEWRWRKYNFAPHRYPNAPHWRGEDLNGKTLLVYVEQGFGDVIQFCRYVPLLAARGAKVLMEEVAELGGLIRRSFPSLAGTFTSPQLPPFDLACSVMSIPLWYGTELNTIPARPSYLAPDAARVESWRRVFQTDPDFKVGIAWAGRSSHADDLNRSTPLASFAPLAEIPGVSFYSLQKGPGAAQIAQPPAGMKLIDLSPRLGDFEDTAAVLMHLDLVISVDTALVHLAGALGRPVWTLISFRPDWRWLLNRTDSPWYPSMKLLRLPRRRDWPAAMALAAAELRKAVHAAKN